MQMISSGFSFDDGDQLLVSAQKPLGMVIAEKVVEESNSERIGCYVSEIDESGSAYRSGVREGDWLVAVQNMDVSRSPFEDVMERIINSPKVVNLRFLRIDD